MLNVWALFLSNFEKLDKTLGFEGGVHLHLYQGFTKSNMGGLLLVFRSLVKTSPYIHSSSLLENPQVAPKYHNQNSLHFTCILVARENSQSQKDVVDEGNR